MTDKNKLPRVMGAFSATMLVVGAMIGAGIFVLSGIAAAYAGPAVIIALACNGLIAVCIGGCYAELASAMPRAGGSYFWVKQALGPGAGFGVGWISLYANTVAAALFVAFEGFEVITRTGEELQQPERNMPRAIFVSIAIGACGSKRTFSVELTNRYSELPTPRHNPAFTMGPLRPRLSARPSL